MKKILTSIVIIFSFIAYAVFHNRTSILNIKNAVPTTPSSPDTSASTSSNTGSSGRYKDGVYTGNAADAFYGNIQVKAIIQNGKISDVQFLQYPNDRDNSIAINNAAMPQLKQEAIQAQSAQVDIVSGATDSSQAFIQSLSSALAQAQ